MEWLLRVFGGWHPRDKKTLEVLSTRFPWTMVGESRLEEALFCFCSLSHRAESPTLLSRRLTNSMFRP